MTDQSIGNITGVIGAVLPSVIGLIQSLVAKQNPGDPPPTSAQVLAVFASACTTSIAKDDSWLDSHPKT